MKLLLIIPYIICLISGSKKLQTTYNKQTTGNPTTNSFIADSKQCYQCNFTDSNALFNSQCANQKIICDNNFCSTMLFRNKDDGEYTLQLGYIPENFCPKITGQNYYTYKNTNDNYMNCCDNSSCNDAKSFITTLPRSNFIVNKKNTTYTIYDTAPKTIVSTILHDFNFANYTLNKNCINEVFFADEDNLIITLKKNRCNNKKISKSDISFSISQPINKIIFLNKNDQEIIELLSSDKSITSFNYIKDKNLLFFISDNYVFAYKIDSNKQLIKINQIYFKDAPVSIAINYNSKVIAIANKAKVIFYDIAQIEQTKKLIPIKATIEGLNIYRVQYAPNKNILLVETYDSNNLNTAIYNLENLDRMEFIGATPPQNRQVKARYMSCMSKYTTLSITPNFLLVNERSYYGKWIIAPVDNFMMNHRVIFACPPPTIGKLPREERYPAYFWAKQINQDGYSVSYDDNATNLDMFINKFEDKRIFEYIPRADGFDMLGPLIKMTDILAVYDYFFSSNHNPVLALIAEERKQATNDRYLYFKRISYSNINESYQEALSKQQKIIRYKLFDLAHSGIFNADSSKLAIFGDNQIQIYSVHLDQDKPPKITTIKILKIKNTKAEGETTKLPEIKTTEAESKTT
jgi:hypothetical protein